MLYYLNGVHRTVGGRYERKEYELHVLTNNKMYIFLLSKILSSSILSFIKLTNFFHQNCLILPNVFISLSDKKINDKFLLDKVDFLYSINIDILQTFPTVELIPEAYLEPS